MTNDTGRRLVLVIGGTRGTGLLIARQLDSRGVSVRVLARDPARAATVLPPTVAVIRGDLTEAATMPAAIDGATDIIFTAGARSGRPVREAIVKAIEYEGMRHTLGAARAAGFGGRFMYMNSSGVDRRSLATIALNLYKGNTLVWRRRAERSIRESGLAYTIIRAGFLLNRPGGTHPIVVTQRTLPLSPRYRIARADVAEAFVAALDHPRAIGATFDVVWDKHGERQPWPVLLSSLQPDSHKPLVVTG